MREESSVIIRQLLHVTVVTFVTGSTKPEIHVAIRNMV